MTAPAPDRIDPIGATVVSAAKDGDHAAIGALASSAFRVSVVFYRYTGVPVDHAEDLAADAVESIIAGLPTLRTVGRYDSWMWSIIRNRLRDHWRSRRNRARELNAPEPMPPDEILVISEEHAAIRRALSSLSLRDRELLWLREVLDLDYRTIADRIDSNTVAARVACHRARQRLQIAYTTVDSEGMPGIIALEDRRHPR